AGRVRTWTSRACRRDARIRDCGRGPGADLGVRGPRGQTARTSRGPRGQTEFQVNLKLGLTSRQESSGKVRWTICNLIPFAKRRLSGHESGSSVLPTAERHEEP